MVPLLDTMVLDTMVAGCRFGLELLATLAVTFSPGAGKDRRTKGGRPTGFLESTNVGGR